MLQRSLLVVLVSVLSVSASTAASSSSKRDRALRNPPPGTIRVIVTTQAGQVAAVSDRIRGRGRKVNRQYAVINAIAAELSAADLDVLDGDRAVRSLSTDALVYNLAAPGGGSAPASTLLPTLGLPLQGLSGKNVGVAVIDSGIEQNGDFSGIKFYDFTNGSGNSAPYDDNGHGTHVAGLIASKGAQSQNAYTGIAPGVRLVAVKVLDSFGQASTSTVIDAIEFVTLNKAALGVHVMNLSLGHPILEPAATDPLVQAVEAAVRAGIVVVVSAGNVGRNIVTGESGYAGILSPANSPSAITVGALDSHNTATRTDDAVAGYSSRGPTWLDAFAKPDLVAPGQNLVSDAAIGSTLFLQYPDRQVAGNGGQPRLMRLNGTSMSSAVVSGVAALMIEASRAVNGSTPAPETIKQALAYTALPLDGLDALTQGHGALNASGAIALAKAVAAAPGSTMAAVAASLPAQATIVAGETLAWSQETDFGDTVVWGNAGGDDRPAWMQTVVWGNDDTVVWGNDDTVVWGNDDTVVWGNTVAGENANESH